MLKIKNTWKKTDTLRFTWRKNLVSHFPIQTRSQRRSKGPRPRCLTKALQPSSQCPMGAYQSHRPPDSAQTAGWCVYARGTRQGPDKACFSSSSGYNPRLHCVWKGPGSRSFISLRRLWLPALQEILNSSYWSFISVAEGAPGALARSVMTLSKSVSVPLSMSRRQNSGWSLKASVIMGAWKAAHIWAKKLVHLWTWQEHTHYKSSDKWCFCQQDKNVRITNLPTTQESKYYKSSDKSFWRTTVTGLKHALDTPIHLGLTLVLTFVISMVVKKVQHGSVVSLTRHPWALDSWALTWHHLRRWSWGVRSSRVWERDIAGRVCVCVCVWEWERERESESERERREKREERESARARARERER